MYSFEWPEHDQHVDELKTVCQEREKLNHVSNVASNIKQGLYESSFDFASYPNPAVLAWATWLKNCMFQASYTANKPYWAAGSDVQIELHESWCHITRDGGYHDMHVHANSTWSCIYYLDCGDMNSETKNGLNRFYCPYNSTYNDAGSAFMSNNNNIDVVAHPGLLVVFPSWLQHSALTYRGQQDRYILSANCRVAITK